MSNNQSMLDYLKNLFYGKEEEEKKNQYNENLKSNNNVEKVNVNNIKIIKNKDILNKNKEFTFTIEFY